MPSARRPLDPDRPTESFALSLRELHRAAGGPKYRVLAAAINASNATVSAILNGHRLPSWEQTQAFVEACGGDSSEWKQRWMRADRSRSVDSASFSGHAAHADATLTPVSDSEFYTAMLAEVHRARYRIMTSYIRLRPAAYFLSFTDEKTSRAAAAYFNAIVAWSEAPGRRSVRRVIATPNEEMMAWAQQLAKAAAEHPNYRIRVIDWPLAADAVNFAIFDDAVAFLAFTTGTTQQLSGFRIDEPAFVRGAIGHFEQLWLAGRELE
ncbi:helix-turn-helix domain-containing protein [Nocardia sp. NPDC052278]|uniref:helix-turn-helix domain-containing protein n=1 Tax=unclassified Nocardia TaxID=2637762 RepID=UPI0036C81D51